MAEDEMNFSSQALERKILTALETAPGVKVPDSFAARVSAKLPPIASIAVTPARYGVRAAIVCLVALAALMLVSAPKTGGTSVFWLSIEFIFCAQFVLLAVWLVARRYRSLDQL